MKSYLTYMIVATVLDSTDTKHLWRCAYGPLLARKHECEFAASPCLDGKTASLGWSLCPCVFPPKMLHLMPGAATLQQSDKFKDKKTICVVWR